MDLDAATVTAVATALGGLLAGASRHTPAIILAVKDALVERDKAASRRLRHRLREVEGQAALCRIQSELPEDNMMALLDLAFEEDPVLGGVVCERGYYVWTFGYERWLGHLETAGLPWDDERFVAKEDLGNSQEVAEKGLGRGNRGEKIVLLNARGLRISARVYSMHPVIAGKRGYRLFLVRLDL